MENNTMCVKRNYKLKNKTKWCNVSGVSTRDQASICGFAGYIRDIPVLAHNLLLDFRSVTTFVFTGL